MDGQGGYYWASANFVWQGPNLLTYKRVSVFQYNVNMVMVMVMKSIRTNIYLSLQNTLSHKAKVEGLVNEIS